MNKRCSWRGRISGYPSKKNLEVRLPQTHTKIRPPYHYSVSQVQNVSLNVQLIFPAYKEIWGEKTELSKPTHWLSSHKEGFGKRKKVKWFSEEMGYTSERKTQRVPMEAPTPLWTNRLWPKPRVVPPHTERSKGSWKKSGQVNTYSQLSWKAVNFLGVTLNPGKVLKPTGIRKSPQIGRGNLSSGVFNGL